MRNFLARITANFRTGHDDLLLFLFLKEIFCLQGLYFPLKAKYANMRVVLQPHILLLRLNYASFIIIRLSAARYR